MPLLATLVERFPLTPEIEEIDPKFRRARLARATVDLLDALCERPLGLVFEDVHAIDEASGDLLAHLVDAATTRPWMIVLTRRPAGSSPLGEQVESPHRRLELGPLDVEAAAGLLEAGGGDELKLSDHDRRALLGAVRGEPPLPARADQRGGEPTSRSTVSPTTWRLLLAAQIDRLAPADRQTLRAAAVVGVWFDLGLLSALLGDDGISEDIWERLRDLVVPERGDQGRFVHALVRDAAYEGLSFRRRRELHYRAALAIEERAPDPEAEAPLLSLHYLHAERFAETWRYARSAGRRAGAVYANVDAATFYRRALEAARRLPAPGAARGGRGGRGPRRRPRASGGVGRVGVGLRGGQTARPPPAPGGCARSRKTGVVHERSGRYPSALRCFSRARGLAGHGAATAVESCEAAVTYAGVRFRQGRHHDCLRWAEQAAKEATECGHRPGLAHALYLVDMARSSLGLPGDGAAQRALAVYEEIDDPVGQGNVLNNMGVDAYYRGQWTDALELSQRSERARDRAGDVLGAAINRINVAEILLDQGRLEEAADLFAVARRACSGCRLPRGPHRGDPQPRPPHGPSWGTCRGRHAAGGRPLWFRALGSKIYELEAETRLLEAAILGGEGAGLVGSARGCFAGRKRSVARRARRHHAAVARIGRGGRKRNGGARRPRPGRGRGPTTLRQLRACSVPGRPGGGGGPDRTGRRRRQPRTGSRRDRSPGLFATLGVVNTPVTSLDDLWPTGQVALRLAGT